MLDVGSALIGRAAWKALIANVSDGPGRTTHLHDPARGWQFWDARRVSVVADTLVGMSSHDRPSPNECCP